MKLPFEPKLLAYSTSWTKNRIATVLIPFPTVKLAELRTHRVLHQHEGEVVDTLTNDTSLSLNANSSRAIPASKQIDMAKTNPYIPIWTTKQKGMQGKYVNDSGTKLELNKIWQSALRKMITNTNNLIKKDVHKQDIGLLVNPFSWTACVISGDMAAWNSFFALRCPNYVTKSGVYYSKKSIPEGEEIVENKSMTYPAVQYIAEIIYDMLMYTTPTYLEPGEWHCPFLYNGEKNIAVSMSKCAMISYDTQDKDDSIESHLNRAKRLIDYGHVSTAEHQYQVPKPFDFNHGNFDQVSVVNGDKIELITGKYFGPVKHWKQLRKLIEAGEFNV